MGQNYISEVETLYFVNFKQQFSSSLTIRMHLSLREGLIKASGHHGTFGFYQLSSSMAQAVDAGETQSSHPLLCLMSHTMLMKRVRLQQKHQIHKSYMVVRWWKSGVKQFRVFLFHQLLWTVTQGVEGGYSKIKITIETVEYFSMFCSNK